MRKRSRARNSWLGIWADACSLGLEASSVIGLRATKIAAGGKPAATEAQGMVSEKIEASLALQGKALSGGLGMFRLPCRNGADRRPAWEALPSQTRATLMELMTQLLLDHAQDGHHPQARETRHEP